MDLIRNQLAQYSLTSSLVSPLQEIWLCWHCKQQIVTDSESEGHTNNPGKKDLLHSSPWWLAYILLEKSVYACYYKIGVQGPLEDILYSAVADLDEGAQWHMCPIVEK